MDLPAPFSPISACTVPGRMVMLTSWLATTPGKRLVTPRTSTAAAGGAADWLIVPLVVIARSVAHPRMPRKCTRPGP